MARFCISCLACCSLLLPVLARAAEPPISADFFLQSIEPAPSGTMLHDFLDIYANTFADCKDTDPYLRALAYLVANGDLETVRDRLKKLEACTNLSESTRQRIAELQKQTTEPAPIQTEPTPTPLADAPAVVAQPSETMAPPMTAQMTPPVVQAAEPVASAPIASVAPVAPVGPATKQAPRKTVRRTSLPVSPTIPMPSRTVPPTVLALPAQEPVLPEIPLLPTPAPLPTIASPWRTEVASRAVYRTGTEGTSRLLRVENTATLGYENWTASATALYLNAGTAGNNEFAGSFFRNNPQRSLLTEQTAFIPQIAYDGDTVDFSLGSSPLGASVSPLPTLRVSYTYKQLKLAVFQESVTDSLLSYVGFRDPFTGQRMGRVMKAGARVGWDDTIGENWFYGGAASGAYLYGKNVKDNTQIRGEFYFGRAFGGNDFGNFAIGSYSAVDHYRTNLNNYTFGHGGYYSPYIAATSVLFVSWEYTGKLGRIKADVSSGLLYETTRDSNHYYGTDGPKAFYRGETHRRITVNAGLEGSLNLSENLSLDSSLRVINSGNFTETRGGLYIKWTF